MKTEIKEILGDLKKAAIAHDITLDGSAQRAALSRPLIVGNASLEAKAALWKAIHAAAVEASPAAETVWLGCFAALDLDDVGIVSFGGEVICSAEELPSRWVSSGCYLAENLGDYERLKVKPSQEPPEGLSERLEAPIGGQACPETPRPSPATSARPGKPAPGKLRPGGRPRPGCDPP